MGSQEGQNMRMVALNITARTPVCRTLSRGLLGAQPPCFGWLRRDTASPLLAKWPLALRPHPSHVGRQLGKEIEPFDVPCLRGRDRYQLGSWLLLVRVPSRLRFCWLGRDLSRLIYVAHRLITAPIFAGNCLRI